MLQIGQGLRDDFIFRELIHGDVHFRLRIFLRLGVDITLQGLAIHRRLVPQQRAVEIDRQIDHLG